jgi:hypothetical protein
VRGGGRGAGGGGVVLRQGPGAGDFVLAGALGAVFSEAVGWAELMLAKAGGMG